MDERDVALGAMLRTLRTAAGMTQEALAERAGISARTVSDVERGLRTSVYAHTARRLASALALDPEAQRRFEEVARGRLASTQATPLPALPVVPTPLIGRADEVDEIVALLTDPRSRLLTLTGPGGIGKTRLAVEAAGRVTRSFPGGVFFVSLGEVTDASLVAAEIAKALDVVATTETLARALAERVSGEPALVVLDTFEHLIPAAPLVYALMLDCPSLTLLMTSRTAVRLRGEREFPVPPLAVPSDDVGDALDLTEWPATALFIERARAVRPGAMTDAASAALVSDICRKVDGLPLAIELAAARVKHLPLEAVRDQLEHRLRLLVGGPLDLPRRQRAIRDTVGWSHGLLAPREQILLRRLSVFSGGWTLDAVEAVCATADDIGEVLEGISALVDHSLVHLNVTQPGPRYDMLEVVREYAAERLRGAGEDETVARRHALHFLELAERAQPYLVRAGHQEWFQRLDAERGNLRRALAWTLDDRDAVAALRFSVALWQYWRRMGEFPEGRRWSEAALAIPGDAPVSLRAKAVGAAAALAFPQGDYGRIATLAAEALELAIRSDDPIDLRNARTLQGMVAMGEGRHADALEAFGEALDICRPLGLTWHLATSHLNLGLALLHAGEPARAETALREALALYRQLGDDVFAARAMNHHAHAVLMQGDVDRGEDLARDSLAEFAEHDEPQGIGDALATLAAVAAARSDADRAATLAGAVAAIRDTILARPAPFEPVIAARFVEPLEDRTGPDRWQHGSVVGRRLSRAAAVEYGLGARGY